MRLDDLKKGDRIFIDANIFIYNFGGRSVECKETLIKCAKGELTGYTLTSVLAEVLHRGKKERRLFNGSKKEIAYL